MKGSVFLLAIILAACASCSKNDEKDLEGNYEYFAFGTAYGMCIGNCTNFYMLKDGKIYADDMDRYIAEAMTFQNTPMPDDKYRIAQQVQNDFPTFLENHPDRTYGCPDCHDQGGIYIEYKKDGVVNKWRIDTDDDKQPAAIREYLAQLEDVVEQLR